MRTSKPLALRPVSWITSIIMLFILQISAELICNLGEFLISCLSGLSTIAFIALVLLFGGLYCSLYFHSAYMMSCLFVTVSDKIYPSNHAFRYYFLGIYEIIGCCFLIFAAMTGSVTGGSMFWFYARYVWLITSSVLMIIYGRSESESRHKQSQSDHQKETNTVNCSDQFIVSKAWYTQGDLYVMYGSGNVFKYENVPDKHYFKLSSSQNQSQYLKTYIIGKYSASQIK